MDFGGRPYLPAIYRMRPRRRVLRTGRQVEKSTLLVNCILHHAVVEPGSTIVVVTPRHEQGRVLASSRLRPALLNSPMLRRILVGRRTTRLKIEQMHFANGSEIYFRAAFRDADACRGLTADLLCIDEYQDLAPGTLPVIEEIQSHVAAPREILVGTPKLIDNPLEAAFRRSTANEWLVTCQDCGDAHRLDDRTMGAHGLVCPDCGSPLEPSAGRWVARNPRSTWAQGYHISQLMVPWVPHPEILRKQDEYDPVKFRNEVLGLSTELGEHMLTRAEIEACCAARGMAADREQVPARLRDRLVLGVDWGGGSRTTTALVVGALDEKLTFHVLFMQRLDAREEPDAVIRQVAALCRGYRVAAIAADAGGNGTVYNRLLLGQFPRSAPALCGIEYGEADAAPVADGQLTRMRVDRSRTIGILFSRVKKEMIAFPRATDAAPFADDFLCVFAEYDAEARKVRFRCPEDQHDDVMHATNYAAILANHLYNRVLGG